tara:strand:- start:1021 stop:1197 length:177 start_codon:yes stop_codon:yes gene_type:complete
MENITDKSKKFLRDSNAVIVKIEGEFGSGIRVTLSNGKKGVGYYPAWKPIDLNIHSFK